MELEDTKPHYKVKECIIPETLLTTTRPHPYFVNS